jgi:hypothetical protein
VRISPHSDLIPILLEFLGQGLAKLSFAYKDQGPRRSGLSCDSAAACRRVAPSISIILRHRYKNEIASQSAYLIVPDRLAHVGGAACRNWRSGCARVGAPRGGGAAARLLGRAIKDGIVGVCHTIGFRPSGDLMKCKDWAVLQKMAGRQNSAWEVFRRSACWPSHMFFWGGGCTCFGQRAHTRPLSPPPFHAPLKNTQ